MQKWSKFLHKRLVLFHKTCIITFCGRSDRNFFQKPCNNAYIKLVIHL